MKIKKNCALLVIDIQQEDFKGMENDFDNPAWECIRNARRVLDVFRAKKLPIIQIKEVHRPDMVDFGRDLEFLRPVIIVDVSVFGVCKI